MNIEKPPISKNTLFNYQDFRLLKDNKTIKLITECNNEYLYWDKVKYKSESLSIKSETFWKLLKTSRNINANNIKFGNYNFMYNINNKISKYLNELDLELSKEITPISNLSKQDKLFFSINSLYEEAIASSIMEGAATTRKIAKEILRKKEAPKNNALTMIVNNYSTMEYIVSIKDKDFSKEILLKIHETITKNTLKDKTDEGNFRTRDNIIVADISNNEPIYQPVKHLEINSMLDDLCKFCNNNDYTEFFIHPIIKAIIIHFLIAYIHPFIDGNGRTARAIFYWYLLKKGYTATEYLAISRIIQKSKNQYEKSFLKCENDDNDLTYFIIYNLKSIVKAKEEFYSYLKKTLDMRKSVSFYIKKYKINNNEAIILKELNSKKDYTLTVIEAQTLLSVSNQTARSALDNLCKKELLEKINLTQNKFGYILKSLN